MHTHAHVHTLPAHTYTHYQHTCTHTHTHTHTKRFIGEKASLFIFLGAYKEVAFTRAGSEGLYILIRKKGVRTSRRKC